MGASIRLLWSFLSKDLGQELRAALVVGAEAGGEVGLGIEGMGAAMVGTPVPEHERRNSVLSVVPSVRPSPSMDSLGDDPSGQFMGRVIGGGVLESG